jgi:hypothetical protein
MPVQDYAYCGWCSQVVDLLASTEHSLHNGRVMCEFCTAEQTTCQYDNCTTITTRRRLSSWSPPLFFVNDCEEYWCEHHAAFYTNWCDCGDYPGRVSEGHYCESYCDDEYDEGYGHDEIMDYSYRPTPNFLKAAGQPKGRTYLGVEIETEATYSIDDGVDALRRHFDNGEFYLKHDGSIDHGFEMVSHPATLEWWQENEDRLQDAMSDMRSVGMRSWNTETCGIHVHLSLKAFDTESHQWLFQQLFYRNADRLEAYAGRDTGEWGNLHQNKGYVGRAMRAKKSGLGTDRYVACNLNPSRTIEIRIFRGSLNPDRILADIELVHAALEYSRTLNFRSFRDGGWKWENFMEWALTTTTDGRLTYPHIQHLVTFIRKTVRSYIASDAAA